MSQLISVIIPVYNSQKTIIKSLESITNQLGSYNFEIIIINDGSTDASEDLINNFISENESLLIKYYHKKKWRRLVKPKYWFKKCSRRFYCFFG